MVDSVVKSARSSEDLLLHVVPLNTGGVDRFVRDVCAIRRNDRILHVGDEETVLELVAAREFFVYETPRFVASDLFKRMKLPRAIYAHSTLDPVRSMVLRLSNLLSISFIMSLHDIDFVGDDVAHEERQTRHEFVRAAYVRFAPSQFILSEAARVLPSVGVVPIENGVHRDISSLAAEYPGYTPKPPSQFAIAVVGALGEHKGLSFLSEVVQRLPIDEKVILVGYCDGRLEPGWLIPDRVWATGAFEPKDLRAILTAARTKLVFFPNRQPESYSYALSDAWIAGYAALVPSAGALGERVDATRAGWTYPSDASADEVARELLQRLNEVSTKSAQVHDATSALLTIGQMVEALEARLPKSVSQRQAPLSKSLPLDELRPHLQEVAAPPNMIETHLNATFMRKEIRKLLGDLAFSQRALVKLEEQFGALSKNYEGRGEWIEKLSGDLEIQARENRALSQKIIDEHEASSLAQAKYERDIEMLQVALKQIDSAVARTAWPARPLLRRWLNRK
jgi:glycosyltransferase involved in cell wall biosynthesis